MSYLQASTAWCAHIKSIERLATHHKASSTLSSNSSTTQKTSPADSDHLESEDDGERRKVSVCCESFETMTMRNRWQWENCANHLQMIETEITKWLWSKRLFKLIIFGVELVWPLGHDTLEAWMSFSLKVGRKLFSIAKLRTWCGRDVVGARLLNELCSSQMKSSLLIVNIIAWISTLRPQDFDKIKTSIRLHEVSDIANATGCRMCLSWAIDPFIKSCCWMQIHLIRE